MIPKFFLLEDFLQGDGTISPPYSLYPLILTAMIGSTAYSSPTALMAAFWGLLTGPKTEAYTLISCAQAKDSMN